MLEHQEFAVSCRWSDAASFVPHQWRRERELAWLRGRVEIRQPKRLTLHQHQQWHEFPCRVSTSDKKLWDDSVARTVSFGQHLSTSHPVVIIPLLQFLTQFTRVVDTAQSTLRIMFGCSARRMRSVVSHRGRSPCTVDVETVVHQRHRHIPITSP